MPTTSTLTKLEGLPSWARQRRIGHYGGALDKENCLAESTPHAWVYYRELQAMRGSAYSYEATTLVHVENLALARSEQARTRCAEKLACNANPTTADEKLEEWISIFGLPKFSDDTRQDMRARVAAHHRLSRGALEQLVDEAVAERVGECFVRTWRARGADLATPPSQTFWPGVNPGPSAYSLGGGAWLSERAHLTVEVRILSGQSVADFLRLMNVELFGLLDKMLPSDMTFNWAVGVETGFVLDYSKLDFSGFGFV